MRIELEWSTLLMTLIKIGITGANGYVGSGLVTHLRKQGYQVFLLTRRRCEDASDFFIPFSLGGERNNYQALDQLDVLIHAAYDFKALNPIQINKINVEGSISLLKEAQRRGVKKIIYISSLSSFAGADSHYGQAKYAVEQYAMTHGVIVLRPGLIFSKNAGGIVGALNRLVKKSPVVPIIGKGDQIFYPCHLGDLCFAITKLIEADIKPKEPLIIASEIPINLKNILTVLARSHRKKILLIPLPYLFFLINLKFAEWIKLNLGLRSDSLKYLKKNNTALDFSSTRELNTPFRKMTELTIHEPC